MSTAQDLVTQALTLSGRLGAGRTPGASESGVVLALANNMLDSWSTERLMIVSIQQATYALAAGTESYTIGPSGVFTATRPVMVQSASIKATVESQTSHFPLRVIGQDEFVQQLRMGDQAAIPRTLYNDMGSPNSTLYLFPIPATNTHLELYTWQQFTQFATLGDTLAFPPGYYRAVSYNLAVEIASAFGLQVPKNVADIAEQAKASIRAINQRLMPDSELDAETAPPDRSSKQGLKAA